MIIKMMNYADELQILSDLVASGELKTAKKLLPFNTNGFFDPDVFIKISNTCLVIDDVLTAEIRQAGDGFNLYYVLRTDDLENALGMDGESDGMSFGVAADHVIELTGTVYMMNDKGTTIHSHPYLPSIPDIINNHHL